MVTLTITDAYATVVEADLLLDLDTVWQAASDDSKTTALLYARYYIDENFSCIDLDDYTDVPDEMKFANALLASDYLSDATVFDSVNSVKMERVKADAVETETEYMSGKKNVPPKLSLVKAVLKTLCSFSGNTVFLSRA